ncbi:microneme/rhoptry antigen, partial [Ophiophagus hannah]
MIKGGRKWREGRKGREGVSDGRKGRKWREGKGEGRNEKEGSKREGSEEGPPTLIRDAGSSEDKNPHPTYPARLFSPCSVLPVLYPVSSLTCS